MARRLRALVLGSTLALLVPAVAQAAALRPTLIAKAGYGGVAPSSARTADGTLHVALESNTNWGDSFNGVAAVAISSSGQVGPLVQALNWGSGGGSPNGIPGLAVMPTGALEATFGGSPSGGDGPWGISSTDGGATWAAPVDVGSGSLAAGYVPLAVTGATPVLAAGCCGGIVIQQGFGPGSNTFALTPSTQTALGSYLALDAASGAVIDGWQANSAAGGGLYLQQVWPSAGASQLAPVNTARGFGGLTLILAGRDKGAGVFGAYPAGYGPSTPIRLLRYGGGSVKVGSVPLLHAEAVGTATGIDGRIWVAWSGYVNGKGTIAVTRSNKAVTRFEPIQRYGFQGTVATLDGDGRLGPLDLLINGQLTGGAQGIYYARIVPVLSASASVKTVRGAKFKLKVKVTDAGDALQGAILSAGGKRATTNSKGKATLEVTGTAGAHISWSVGDGGYQTLTATVKL